MPKFMQPYDILDTHKYKGKTIWERSKYSKKTLRWLKPYFVVAQGGPYGQYRTLASAKKAVDIWEHKQFKRDKPKGWEK
jgi:hypothetical protein